ncbi:L-lactate permease [Rubrobacter indicoceani]|uniref:L-lactate permease n=1 Tax=Rubrobacter indicoceani TaxID=2051957 RepID=UPI000E5B351D|nr:L-lactate permease [Rubrobacter indicoceani]
MVELAGVLVAGSPFLVAGVALLGFGWSAFRTGLAALSAAILGAVLWPPLSGSGVLPAVLGSVGTSWDVVFVLFGGLLLYRLLASGPGDGQVGAVSRFLGSVEPERAILAVAVVVGAGAFFESVTGFGVAVVICAPILLAAGFSPIKAAVLAMWSQCAVPWGALGVGTVIGADLSGLTFARLSDLSALLNLPLFPVYAGASLLLAGGLEALRRHGVEALMLGLAAGFGTLATSLFVAPELSGAVGGAVALGVFLLRRRVRLREVGVPVRAVVPYGFLVAGIIAVSTLSGALPERIAGVISGPGLPLFATSAFAVALLGLRPDDVEAALRKTVAQWLPTAGSIVVFVAAGQVVAVCGGAAVLAGFAAKSGAFYPVAASLVGGVGGALTGSNAASNALFMPFQSEAARNLGDGAGLIAAVQNVSGSHASMLAPQRIVLAAAAVGLTGSEGELIRRALPPVAISIFILAGVALLFSP